jgi:hypothetical protein
LANDEHWKGVSVDKKEQTTYKASPTASKWPLMLRLSKVFVDPLRMRILAECNMREMSPKEFHQEFGGGSLSRVSRAFEILAEYDWLELTRTETGGERRGGVEHFYIATGPAVFDEDLWPEVPESMRKLLSWRVVETLVERTKEAMAAGTIDTRIDRHMSWMPLLFDQQGWESAIEKVDALFYWFREEQEEANLRMVESGEAPIPMTAALAVFESPKDTEKQP